MPTITTLPCFDVPKIDRIEGTPCVVVPCPFCKVAHRLPADTTEIVKAPCAFRDGGREPADYWSLVHGGRTLRQMVLALETGDPLDEALLNELVPRDLWWPFQTIPGDPTNEPNPFAGNLEAQRQMGAEFDRATKDMSSWLDDQFSLKNDQADD